MACRKGGDDAERLAKNKKEWKEKKGGGAFPSRLLLLLLSLSLFLRSCFLSGSLGCKEEYLETRGLLLFSRDSLALSCGGIGGWGPRKGVRSR